MYCVLRIMSCILVHNKVNNTVGKLIKYLLMADVTGADDDE